jgi:hypothetical protein
MFNQGLLSIILNFKYSTVGVAKWDGFEQSYL